ncbi:M23 family metallopeptidase [Gordonia hirsuta]|uniref:M23 family metallopeptidase n=1 Tax=Gordonia hirsuta TaxID=53427 RepID=UPI00034CF5C9
MASDQRGGTAVVDRTNDSFDVDYSPTTRDIPLPPRSVRIGLSPASTSPAAPASTAVTPAPITPAAGSPAAGTVTESASVPATAAAPVRPTPSTAKRTARRDGPPSSLKARTALVAVAAGAVAVAVTGSSDNAQSVSPAATPSPAAPEGGAQPLLAASSADLDGGVVPAASTADMDSYGSQLTVGKQLAAAAAAREAAARKPLFAAPLTAKYSFTSGFAMRWGSFHGGLDLAAPLGTPIHAVTDGVVKEAGPASGYGNWIQIKADDGTVTLYGHMASSGVLVSKGQKVTAGDVIGLVGSEGFSTGPHLHFEVWKNGTTKIDPAPWLAKHGIRLNAYTG